MENHIQESSDTCRVTAHVFDGVELLDLFGPIEVFDVANRVLDREFFSIHLVANQGSITAGGGVEVVRAGPLDSTRTPDLLLIPGGPGVDSVLECDATVRWIQRQAECATMVASVCSGAVLLGRCGLLDGLRATTHNCRLDQLKKVAPRAEVVGGTRFVDNGRFLMSAGIATGIDLALHLVGRICGKHVLVAVAERMEYTLPVEPATPTTTINESGQPIGLAVDGWSKAKTPRPVPMDGRYCRVAPLDMERHAQSLGKYLTAEDNLLSWTYLPYGPFDDEHQFSRWLGSCTGQGDPMFFAIVDKRDGEAKGLASYLRINPDAGSIEVGHLHFGSGLRKTPAATEAMHLMMASAFDELGYRRYEWKCDALNRASRRAAVRLGFSLEGVFRQATVYKGRNRDTAWFSITNKEWPRIKEAHRRWLDESNFDEEGDQRSRLSDFMQRIS